MTSVTVENEDMHFMLRKVNERNMVMAVSIAYKYFSIIIITKIYIMYVYCALPILVIKEADNLYLEPICISSRNNFRCYIFITSDGREPVIQN